MTEYKEYIAWDATTRWFHWINALAVISLIVTGLVVLFDNELGLSAEGKITLKSIHVSFGYVMALNLLWRGVMMSTDFWGVKWVDRLHAAASTTALVLVGLHVGGVIFASIEHGENLARAMITGWKRAQ